MYKVNRRKAREGPLGDKVNRRKAREGPLGDKVNRRKARQGELRSKRRSPGGEGPLGERVPWGTGVKFACESAMNQEGYYRCSVFHRNGDMRLAA